jgi:hypothetical protein
LPGSSACYKRKYLKELPENENAFVTIKRFTLANDFEIGKFFVVHQLGHGSLLGKLLRLGIVVGYDRALGDLVK